MRFAFSLIALVGCCWCATGSAQHDNDTCGTAFMIAGPGVTVFNSTGAVTEPGYDVGNSPQSSSCAQDWFPDPISNDIWFKYEAAGDSTVISTCGTSFDTKLEIYNGCPQSALNLVACNDDSSECDPQSRVVAVTVPMQMYYVRVGGWLGSSSTTGPGMLTIESGTTAANDECTSAIDLGTGNVDMAYDNSMATTGLNQPAVASALCTTWSGSTCENDIWYEYTAASDETLFELCDAGTNTDSVLEVYSACPASAATLLACDDDGCSPTTTTSSIVLATTVGAIYRIRVGTWAGASPGDGMLTIVPLGEAVTDVTCTSGGLTALNDYTINFNWPGIANPGDTVTISSDEPGVSNPIVTLTNTAGGGTPGTHTGTLLAPNHGMFLDVTFEVRFHQGLLTSLPVPCVVAFSPLPGDQCSTAVAVGSGTVSTPFDNTFALTHSPDFASAPTASICASWTPNGISDEIFGDLFFTYTADSFTEQVTVSLCSGSGGANALTDTKLAVYSTTACPTDLADLIACDDDSCGDLLSEAIVDVVPGSTYLIQVGSADAIARGTGVLEVSPRCPEITNFEISFDCLAEVVTVTWVENAAYTALALTANGVPVAVGPTPIGVGLQNTFMETPLLGTEVTYELTATCGSGTTTMVAATINTAIPGADNIILDFELADAVDSGAALETALLLNGVTVTRITDDQNPCIPDLIAAATNVWVMLGTFPSNFELPQSLGDQLHDAVVVDGKGVYVEGGDHWAFDPASDFDLIDGVDSTSVADGDDSLDLLSASNATLGGLDLVSTFPQSRVYNQPNAGANDWTDQLAVHVDTGLFSAEAIWRNDPGPNVGVETDYVVGVASVTPESERTIVASFEFGGLSGIGFGPSAPADLAGLYLNYFDGPSSTRFQRGDCNVDNSKNIADAVRLLNFLFPANPPATPVRCDDSCDANDDGGLNIADAVTMLNILFPTGPSIPWLAPDLCGEDPTLDMLGCADYTTPMGLPWCP